MGFRFSLRRMLAGVTLVAIVLGLVKAYPEWSVFVAKWVSFYLPTGLFSFLLARCSRRRWVTLAVTHSAALVALLLTPHKFPLIKFWGAPPSFWHLYLIEFEDYAFWPLVAAAVSGLATKGILGVTRRYTP